MANKEQEVVSAQVMLRSASGKAPDAHLTAETIHQYAPSPEAAARAPLLPQPDSMLGRWSSTTSPSLLPSLLSNAFSKPSCAAPRAAPFKAYAKMARPKSNCRWKS